ncbi:hypothetical protein [Planctomicrobium sp. SH527]|uniref:hypothetical protein n=1 Tax=Planctomicrobium sp. SH527 TaxID=3448123 RepID=UPI003F5BF900
MDKLQPLIRQRFWILAGLVLPLVMYGYYSANSQLKAATAAREEKLKSTLNGVSSGIAPNEDYIKQLTVFNEFLEASVDDAIVQLWQQQQKRMTWPPLVANKVPKDFLGPFDQQVPLIYKGAYEEVFRKLQERVQPVRPLDPMARFDRNKPIQPNQKVVLMANLPQVTFGQFVTSEETWDAQIDVWMTELLLDAIVKMNEGKDSATEAVIRRLDILQLLGGDGTPKTSDSGSSGMEGDMMGGMEASAMGMGMGGGSQGAANIPTKIDFDPAEEFGPALDSAGGMGEMSMDMMSMEGAGGTGPAPPRRYIGDPEAAPYFERGFYMSVIIQQNKIADFIVELANSDWPVQVRRFQVGVNPYRTNQPQGGFESMPGVMDEFSMGEAGMGAFGPPTMEAGPSMAGGLEFSGQPGMGGFGDAMGGRGVVRPNIFAQNLPPFASQAMNHPDLVRLDVCGVITMYKQPTEVLEAVKVRKANPQSPAGGAGPAGAAPAAAPAVEPTTEPTAEPATEEGTPAPTAMPAAADGAAPAATPAIPAPVNEAIPAPATTTPESPAAPAADTPQANPPQQ